MSGEAAFSTLAPQSNSHLALSTHQHYMNECSFLGGRCLIQFVHTKKTSIDYDGLSLLS